MKNIAIVILNWNGTKDTVECLESIGKLQIINYKLQVIVVDNGSADAFASVISNFKLGALREQISNKNIKFKILRNEKNLGFSGGNNVGIRHALKNGADYVVILNNDTVVHKSLIEELLTVADSEEKIGIVAPKIYFAKGFEFHKDRYKKNDLGKIIWYAGGTMDWENVLGHHRGVDEVDTGQFDEISPTDFASGCCLLIKKEVLERVGPPAGGFDEQYFLYYEDSDLCQRVKGKGYRVMFVPSAILWHKNAGSAGGSGSKLQDYFITRNRLLFGFRFAPIRSKLALLRESIGLLFNGRSWQRRGVLDFYLGGFGRGSYPI